MTVKRALLWRNDVFLIGWLTEWFIIEFMLMHENAWMLGCPTWLCKRQWILTTSWFWSAQVINLSWSKLHTQSTCVNICHHDWYWSEIEWYDTDRRESKNVFNAAFEKKNNGIRLIPDGFSLIYFRLRKSFHRTINYEWTIISPNFPSFGIKVEIKN